MIQLELLISRFNASGRQNMPHMDVKKNIIVHGPSKKATIKTERPFLNSFSIISYPRKVLTFNNLLSLFDYVVDLAHRGIDNRYCDNCTMVVS